VISAGAGLAGVLIGSWLATRREEEERRLRFIQRQRDWRRAAPLARTTLRGREDWTKHFFVSAALTVLSAQAPSDAVGVSKEELCGFEGT
jgi:hypothetical protein